MGTEYSDECEYPIFNFGGPDINLLAGYCGNTINTGSAIADVNGCSMGCSGDSSELCGGPLRLSFYKVKPTGPSTVQTAGVFSFQNCYTEATNIRALSSKATAASTMTVEQCSTFCTGYSMMGVEYGQECKFSRGEKVHRQLTDLLRLLW